MTRKKKQNNKQNVILKRKSVPEKVLELLARRYPQALTNKEIAFATIEDQQIVNVTLSRLAVEMKIERAGRGKYRRKTTELDLDLDYSQMQFHHLLIHSKCYQGVVEVLPQHYITKTHERTTWKLKFWDNDVVIMVHNRGLIEIHLNCTKHPIDVHGFVAFRTWIEALFYKYPLKRLKLRIIEFNIHTHRFKLELPKSIYYQDFEGRAVRIYQKEKDKLRFESIYHGKIDFTTAINLLKRLVTPPEKKGTPSEWENGDMEYIR